MSRTIGPICRPWDSSYFAHSCWNADEDYLFLQSLEHRQYPEREMVQEILYFYYIGRMKYYKVSGDQTRLAEWDRRTNVMFFFPGRKLNQGRASVGKNFSVHFFPSEWK